MVGYSEAICQAKECVHWFYFLLMIIRSLSCKQSSLQILPQRQLTAFIVARLSLSKGWSFSFNLGVDGTV